MHDALSSPAVAATWRSRGRVLSTHNFERFLTEGLEYGAVGVSVVSGELLAWLEMREYDARDRVATLGVAACGPSIGSGLAIEASLLFVDECFWQFELRKLYALLSDDAERALGVGLLEAFAAREGRMLDHVFLNGRYQDVSIWAMDAASLRTALRSTDLDGLARDG